MEKLVAAHRDVGGDLVSAGGTGTYDCNAWATEIQAGSYALMDTAYAKLGLPFTQAVSARATVISVSEHHAVGRLRAEGAGHGSRQSVDSRSARAFCSDEHVTWVTGRGEDADGHTPSPIDWESGTVARVGDRIRLVPAHVDPTLAYHEHLFVLDGDDVVEEWPIDLRGW